MVNPFDWIVLKSRYIVKDKWISIRSDTCQMPNGTIVDPYYVLEYPTWVNVVALTKNQEVILVKQYRHGLRKTILELPSGAVEAEDVLPVEAAPNPANHNNLTHCFLATDVEHVADLKLDATEQIDVVLLPLQKVIEDIDQGIFLQTLHISSLFFALKKLGKVQFS